MATAKAKATATATAKATATATATAKATVSPTTVEETGTIPQSIFTRQITYYGGDVIVKPVFIVYEIVKNVKNTIPNEKFPNSLKLLVNRVVARTENEAIGIYYSKTRGEDNHLETAHPIQCFRLDTHQDELRQSPNQTLFLGWQVMVVNVIQGDERNTVELSFRKSVFVASNSREAIGAYYMCTHNLPEIKKALHLFPIEVVDLLDVKEIS